MNIRVNLDLQGNQAVGVTTIEPGGKVVHPEGYGPIRIFRIVFREGGTEHRATDDQTMDEPSRLGLAERTWAIKNDDRGLEQCRRVEWSQPRAGRAQHNQIGMATRAFLRLERHFYATGVSWFEARGELFEEQSERPSPIHSTAFRDPVTPTWSND